MTSFIHCSKLAQIWVSCIEYQILWSMLQCSRLSLADRQMDRIVIAIN